MCNLTHTLSAQCHHGTESLMIIPLECSFDGATYLFAFLNVATTNLYSSARAQDGADSEKAESVVRTSAQVALRSGLGLMLFLLLATRPLLTLYIGDKAASTPGKPLRFSGRSRPRARRAT